MRRGLVALVAGTLLAIAAQSDAPAQTAAGLIKQASAGLPVKAFEQVTIGQTIPLGTSGHLKISYYTSCLLETIDGGTVTIGSFSSRVAGGKIVTTTDTQILSPHPDRDHGIDLGIGSGDRAGHRLRSARLDRGDGERQPAPLPPLRQPDRSGAPASADARRSAAQAGLGGCRQIRAGRLSGQLRPGSRRACPTRSS